ncbi:MULTISPECIES: radical SAM family heme chaperone HemW [unclassified Campylobacter]|uniref:radical SAM family heme chaperone HemW n=1 Tax=unclassified Campylobacter TaxID=2593542 RepID=UPI003D354B50
MLLYAHVPFCESKCPYCAFGSVVGRDKMAKNYFDAMIIDFKYQAQKFAMKKEEISTLFIGGGTPSAVNAELYEKLFDEISPFLAKDAEITSEANPNSATLKWLIKMRKFGVNRISFGAQSFFEDKLKFLGRTHSARQIYKAVEMAKISGFDNINIDLIYGTKLDNKKRLTEEIENVKNLEILHLSAYSLTLEPKTPFYKKNEYKKDSPTLAKFLINQIESIGLKQYEISNFGQVCRHNLGYWQAQNYIGIGAYAIGFLDDYRVYSPENLDEYLKDPCAKKFEHLSSDEMKLERLFLGFRSIVGVAASELSKEQIARANILKQAKKLDFKDGRYYARNFLLADELALFVAN